MKPVTTKIVNIDCLIGNRKMRIVPVLPSKAVIFTSKTDARVEINACFKYMETKGWRDIFCSRNEFV